MIDDKIPLTTTDNDLPERLKGKSCCVVGSSNTILGSLFGTKIDNHDVIIRCNQAFVDGFQNDVGFGMSARFINGHNFCATNKNWPGRKTMTKKHPMFDPDFLLKVKGELIICKDHDTVLTETPKMIEHLQNNGNQVLLIHPRFKSACATIIGRDPTCGFVAVMFALRLYQNISCFGFKMGPEGYHHYYEQIVPYDQSCHNFSCEFKSLEGFADTQKLIMK